MKIYVAGKWEERKRIKSIMNKLVILGHTITADWTSHTQVPNNLECLCAIHDLFGVRVCDIVIVIADKEYSYKGALCELGAALILDKRVYIIGNFIDSCIFINHPLCIKVNNLQTLYEILKGR